MQSIEQISMLEVLSSICPKSERTSEGGNGNNSVLLPIILIKDIVHQMLLSIYIRSMSVSVL